MFRFCRRRYGEKIVIRILDKAALTGSIDQMGMDEGTLDKFKKAIDAPHGMILVTGPTGSGKTTTLYSVLQELNNPQYNIVTVEDPIEYELTGINQVSVRNDIGLDFASALRSILRQDPDIVMVGEIRDNETADIAVKAALTGHQVLEHAAHERRRRRDHASRRHGDRAVPDFQLGHHGLRATARPPHLHELPRGIRARAGNLRTPFDEGSRKAPFSITGAVATAARAGAISAAWRLSKRCPVSESIRRLIIKRASSAVVKNQAITEGMKTLRMVGLDKALEGVTTLEEIWRVTGEDH